MSNEVLKYLINLEGYCCIRGYLLEHAKKGSTHKAMATRLGVARSVITWNYKRMREDKSTHRCPCGAKCYLKTSSPK